MNIIDILWILFFHAEKPHGQNVYFPESLFLFYSPERGGRAVVDRKGFGGYFCLIYLQMWGLAVNNTVGKSSGGFKWKTNTATVQLSCNKFYFGWCSNTD